MSRWADSGTIVMPWTLLDTEESFTRFADGLAMLPIGRAQHLAIPGALVFAGSVRWQRISRRAQGHRYLRKWANNRGPRIKAARDVVADGITINGLPIMTRLRWGGGLYSIAGLDFYFDDCVVGGPGARRDGRPERQGVRGDDREEADP